MSRNLIQKALLKVQRFLEHPKIPKNIQQEFFEKKKDVPVEEKKLEEVKEE